MQFTDGYALLIGTGKTRAQRFLRLPVENDIDAINTFLVNPMHCGYPEHHVRPLCNEAATAQGIDAGLAWLADQARGNPQATILFYYSGHGWSDEQDRYYLIQYDTDDDRLSQTAYSARRLLDGLNEIRARHLILIFDCCRAAGVSAGKGAGHLTGMALPKSLSAALGQSQERVVFASSLEGQKSWFHPQRQISLFTYYFLEGLQGANSQPNDTEVRIALVIDHVSRKVAESARELLRQEQTPSYELKGQNFPIALLGGGKGLGSSGWPGYRKAAQANIDRVAPPIQQTGGDGSIMVGRNVSGSTLVTGTISYDEPATQRRHQAPDTSSVLALESLAWLLAVLRTDQGAQNRNTTGKLAELQLDAIDQQLALAIEALDQSDDAGCRACLRDALAMARTIRVRHKGLDLLRFALDQLVK